MDSEFYLVIGRTLLVLVILFFLTKLMGKKQVSQMNIYDYLVGITIGNIAADIALDINKDMISGIASLVILALSGVLVTYLTLKSIYFRKIFLKTNLDVKHYCSLRFYYLSCYYKGK